MNERKITKPVSQIDGIKAIGKYIGRSDCTVLKLIKLDNFPAVKMGGSWTSDSKLIDTWRAALNQNDKSHRKLTHNLKSDPKPKGSR